MTAPAVTGSCPKCGSTAIRAVAVKRSAIADGLAKEFFQTAGAGAAGSRDAVTQGVCTRCGCRWVPRTADERRVRALSGQLGQVAQRAAQAERTADGVRAAARAASVFARIPPAAWLLIAAIIIGLVLVVVT